MGFLINSISYLVRLDPHHNLTASAGYGGLSRYPPGLSLYEPQEETIHQLNERINYLHEELKAAEELLTE